jgi:hypothetical protein
MIHIMIQDPKHGRKYTKPLRKTGSFPQVNVEHEQWCGDNVLAVMKINSSSSICRISRTGVAQTQAWRILLHDGFYPYYLQSVQYPLP